VIVELKAVEKVNQAHKNQLLTSLRLSGMKLDPPLTFAGGGHGIFLQGRQSVRLIIEQVETAREAELYNNIRA